MRHQIRRGARAGAVVQAHTRSYHGAGRGDRPIAPNSDLIGKLGHMPANGKSHGQRMA